MTTSSVPLWHRALHLLRKADKAPAQHVADVIAASNSFSDLTRLNVRNTGTSVRDFSASLEAIEAALQATVASARTDVDLPFVLGSDRTTPALVFSYERDPLAFRGSYDLADINFTLSRPLIGPGGLFTFADLMKYTALMVEGFDAATASVHESRLFELIASTYSTEMAKSQIPRSEYKYLPVSEIVRVTPPALVKRLSHVRHPTSFDLTRIPPAVFWINYWNPRQVKAVGEDRVRSAPWAFVAEHPRGGLLLATQTEEFDGLNRDHLQRVARIADTLDLYAVQSGEVRS